MPACMVCTGCGEIIGPKPGHAILLEHRRCPGALVYEDLEWSET
jgi:hypothetical protein